MVNIRCFAGADTNAYQHLEPWIYLYIISILKENSGSLCNLRFPPCFYKRWMGQNKCLQQVGLPSSSVFEASHILFLPELQNLLFCILMIYVTLGHIWKLPLLNSFILVTLLLQLGCCLVTTSVLLFMLSSPLYFRTSSLGLDTSASIRFHPLHHEV